MNREYYLVYAPKGAGRKNSRRVYGLTGKMLEICQAAFKCDKTHILYECGSLLPNWREILERKGEI